MSGIGVRYTNQSLRATAITRMFINGISEKVIADTSGHRSTKSLRCYEHTSEQQQRAVTAVINNSSATSDEKKPQFPMEASENRPPMPEVCALP